MTMVYILSEGPVEERVREVLECLLYNGDILKTHDRWGAILVKADATEWIVVPRDVMEYMIDRDLLTFSQLHS